MLHVHIKSIGNASATYVWQMLSKSVTFSFEIFTRCEKFMRIHHTCDRYEMGKKYGSTALSVTTDIHVDPNNRWTYVLLSCICVLWYNFTDILLLSCLLVDSLKVLWHHNDWQVLSDGSSQDHSFILSRLPGACHKTWFLILG